MIPAVEELILDLGLVVRTRIPELQLRKEGGMKDREKERKEGKRGGRKRGGRREVGKEEGREGGRKKT